MEAVSGKEGRDQAASKLRRHRGGERIDRATNEKGSPNTGEKGESDQIGRASYEGIELTGVEAELARGNPEIEEALKITTWLERIPGFDRLAKIEAIEQLAEGNYEDSLWAAVTC